MVDDMPREGSGAGGSPPGPSTGTATLPVLGGGRAAGGGGGGGGGWLGGRMGAGCGAGGGGAAGAIPPAMTRARACTDRRDRRDRRSKDKRGMGDIVLSPRTPVQSVTFTDRARPF